MIRNAHLLVLLFLVAACSDSTAPTDDVDLVLAPEIVGTLAPNPTSGVPQLQCRITAQLVGNVEWTDLYLTFFLEIKRTDTGEIITQPIIGHYFPGSTFVDRLQHEGLPFAHSTEFDFDAAVRYRAKDGVSRGIVKHSRCALPRAA